MNPPNAQDNPPETSGRTMTDIEQTKNARTTEKPPLVSGRVDPLVGPLPPLALTPKESDLWAWAWDGLDAVLDDDVFLRDNPGFELSEAEQREDIVYRLDEQLADMIASPGDAESKRTQRSDERARRSLVAKLKTAWGMYAKAK